MQAQKLTQAAPKQESLLRRFLGNTIMVVAGVMLISFVVIDLVYRSELEKAVYDKLQLHIFALLSVAEIKNNRIQLPDIAHDPKLNTGNSNLWAIVLDGDKNTVWTSLSLSGEPRQLELSTSAGSWQYGKNIHKGDNYLTAAFQINWYENQLQRSYHLLVAENRDVLKNDIRQFRQWLFGAFAAMTAILLITQYMVLLRAFKPIRLLEKEIHNLEQGEQNRLTETYPKELSGVTNSLNALIKKEHAQRERYRSSMADLAHSLKTPMAVINTEIAGQRDTRVLRDAVKRIDSTIEYQLRRAVLSNHTILEQHTDVKSVLQQVIAALEKIYRDKEIKFSSNLNDEIFFPADENDLMEIFGNLLDNAYKFANKAVRVSVFYDENNLSIIVEDDGKGLDTNGDASSKVFLRGERLDSQGLGQGIGLAVVVDIVKGYEGKIEAGQSTLGGALFHLEFPKRSLNI